MTGIVRSTFAALSAAALFAAPAIAGAQGFHTQTTLKAGTKIACTLDEAIDSANLQTGTDFKLKVVDPNQPSLHGAEIHGHVTDVRQPGNGARARIGFLLDYIRYKDGSREPIRATVLSRQVVYTNTAANRAATQQMMAQPVLPHGTVTPGPVAWQMRIGLGGGSNQVSVAPPNTGQSGGYLYAKADNETIVIPAGVPVTIQLTNDLSVT